MCTSLVTSMYSRIVTKEPREWDRETLSLADVKMAEKSYRVY